MTVFLESEKLKSDFRCNYHDRCNGLRTRNVTEKFGTLSVLSDAAIAFQLDITSCPHEHDNGLALLIEELPKKNREFQLHPLPGSAVYYPFDLKGATNETLQACMVTQSLVVMGFGFQCL